MPDSARIDSLLGSTKAPDGTTGLVESADGGGLGTNDSSPDDWLTPNRLQRMVGTLPGGIFIQDASNRVLYANEAAARLKGFGSAKEMLERPAGSVGHNLALFDVLGAPFPPQRLPGRLSAEMGQSHEAVLRIRLLPDGGERWVLKQATPLPDPETKASLALCYIQELTERRRAKEVARMLAESSSVFESTPSPAAPLAAVARLVVPLFADACIVSIRDLDGTVRRTTLAHRDPELERRILDLVEQSPSLAMDQIPSTVIRTGEPVLIPEVSADQIASIATTPPLRLAAKLLHPASYICVPLIARGRVLGALELISTMAGRFGAHDLELAKDVARRAALSSDNTQLFEAEQKARLAAEQAADRVARLLIVTAALAETLTRDAVARVVLDEGTSAFGAQAGLLALLGDDGMHLEMIAATGYSGMCLERYRHLPLDAPVPLAEAMRLREALFFSDAAKDLHPRYPELAVNEPEFQALAVLPILVEGRAIGALALSFGEHHAFEPAERAFAHALIRQCAQALDRARLYEAEKDAVAAEAAARKREAFLSEASAKLSRTLDWETTLQSLAEHAVEGLAEWSLVHVVNRRQVVREASAMSASRLGAPSRLEDQQRAVNELALPGVEQVLNSGTPVFLPKLGRDEIRSLSPDPESLRVLHDAGIRSLIQLPLTAGGRGLGVLTLIRARGERYGQTDFHLAKELAERAALVMHNVKLHQDVTKAGKAREEFLAAVSHDLKNPLGAILINAQMLQSQGMSSQDPVRVQRRADTIVRSVRRMQRLIHDLLDTAEIDAGALTIDMRPTDLESLLLDAVELVHTIAADKGIDLKVDPIPHGPRLLCDRERVLQVLSNVLGNAVKFTPEGGRVQVALDVEATGTVRFSIVDNGPGMQPAELTNAFNRFWRSRASEQTGTGLGLFIARGIVEAHGGRIGIDSEPNRGATVWFTVPAEGG